MIWERSENRNTSMKVAFLRRSGNQASGGNKHGDINKHLEHERDGAQKRERTRRNHDISHREDDPADNIDGSKCIHLSTRHA